MQDLNIIIFAGGAGTRLWPLSLENEPKQFVKFFDQKSTLELTYGRVKKFEPNVFLATHEKYKEIVTEQIPLKQDRILLEKSRRDLTAAVGLAIFNLKKMGISGPVALVWSDHVVKNEEKFREVLENAREIIKIRDKKIVFIGEKPIFPNQNLGWLKIGKNGEFEDLIYRPSLEKTEEFFRDEKYLWNTGYFVSSVENLVEYYEKYQPKIAEILEKCVNGEEKMYEEIPKISFDEGIISKIPKDDGLILKTELGWSDPGTLYAFKELLSRNEKENVLIGEKVFSINSVDNLVVNEEKNKIISVLGMEGVIVVNTEKRLLICNKNNVGDIKEFLKKIKEEGLEEYV